MIVAALAAARQHGGAIPACARTWSRPTASIGQRPRHAGPGADAAGVPCRPLLQAYLAAAAEGFEGTDTSSCMQKFTDVDRCTFPGAATNLKVTFAPDMAVAERLLTVCWAGSVAGTR